MIPGLNVFFIVHQFAGGDCKIHSTETFSEEFMFQYLIYWIGDAVPTFVEWIPNGRLQSAHVIELRFLNAQQTHDFWLFSYQQ